MGDIAEWAGIGGLGPIVVGSGAEVADELQEWVSETDVDGFNLAYAVTPGTFEDIVGACDSGADQTRCLPERLRRGNAAQQTVRARGQAPARTPRPELRPDPHCRLSGDLRTNRTRVREPRW